MACAISSRSPGGSRAGPGVAAARRPARNRRPRSGRSTAAPAIASCTMLAVRVADAAAGRPRAGRTARPAASASIAGFANSSSPAGLKIATSSSMCSTADWRFAFWPASCDRSADSCALTVLKKLPSSPNSSCCGRSSRTPNSPRPRRVRPLRITWIGRSISCANDAGDRPSRRAARRGRCTHRRPQRPSQNSRRTSSVDTPMRIDAELLAAEQQRLPHLERRLPSE